MDMTCSRPELTRARSGDAPDEMTDVRDVHGDVEGAVSVRRHRQRVIQVAGTLRIDREHALGSQIHAGFEVVSEAAQGWQLRQHLTGHHEAW